MAVPKDRPLLRSILQKGLDSLSRQELVRIQDRYFLKEVKDLPICCCRIRRKNGWESMPRCVWE